MRKILRSLVNFYNTRNGIKSGFLGRSKTRSLSSVIDSLIGKRSYAALLPNAGKISAFGSITRLRSREVGVKAIDHNRRVGSAAVRASVSPHHQIYFDGHKVYVPWDEGITSAYHNIWLRDSCRCEECVHPITKQRQLNTFKIPDHIQPKEVETNESGLKIIWSNDNHQSIYPWDWLYMHSYKPILKKLAFNFPQTFWKAEDVAEEPPTVSFNNVMESEAAVGEWTYKIQQYGFCFVNDVPPNPEDTERLIKRIAFIRPTHYGGFWDFTSDLSSKDTAYTNLALDVHTDGTYFSDPPGLQMLHLLEHNGTGGRSVLVDGFKAARVLRDEAPDLYKVLSRIRVPAHSAGNEDTCIIPASPNKPILNHNDLTGELFQIRWNNDDRSAMDRWYGSNADTDVLLFYQSIKKWHEILTRPEMEYWFRLQPGKALIFDNWRVLHGRESFTGARRLCGAYLNMDDFLSRLRLTNLGRDKVLQSL
ncbi:hypothetical protein V1511DRAFT_496652 [Dipodascopsis uninucleata]